MLGGCGDRVVSGAEECDDGGVRGGDGCGTGCRVEDGWACGGGGCLRVLEGMGSVVNSVGVVLEYRYLRDGGATSANLTSVRVTNGTAPGNIRVVRPVGDPLLVRVLLDYCGLPPEQNITV